MIVATFNYNPSRTIICNSSANASDEKDLDIIYNELLSLVRSIPKHNVHMIGGDMNAQIGKNENNKLSLHRNMTQTTQTVHYEWSLNNNRDISDKYKITLRNKFDALQKISETLAPNDEYENFVNSHMEVAVEYIPTWHKSKTCSMGDFEKTWQRDNGFSLLLKEPN